MRANLYRLLWCYVAAFALGAAVFASAGIHDPGFALAPMGMPS